MGVIICRIVLETSQQECDTPDIHRYAEISSLSAGDCMPVGKCKLCLLVKSLCDKSFNAPCALQNGAGFRDKRQSRPARLERKGPQTLFTPDSRLRSLP